MILSRSKARAARRELSGTVLARQPAPGADILFFAADPDFQVATFDDRQAFPRSSSRYRHTVVAASGPGAHAVAHARLYWQGAAKATEVLWDWDATAKGWRRTQNAEAHVDGAS